MSALVTLVGIDVAAVMQAAVSQAPGSQRQKYCQDIVAALGNTPRFELWVGGVLAYRANISSALSVSNGAIQLPSQFVEPPTVNNTASFSGVNAVMRLQNTSNGSVYAEVPVRVSNGNGFLEISKDTDGTNAVRSGSTSLLAPTTLDVSDDWLQTALSDMRKNPATFSGNYIESYAPNDATLRLRNESYVSSQTTRACLTQGRYGTPTAFTTTNPDYLTELSWVPAGHPDRYLYWDRIIAWDELFQSDEGGGNGAAGYVGNTRVLTFGKQLWVRYTNGQWARLASADEVSGEVWRPNFGEYGGNVPITQGGNYDARDELGGTSFRTTPAIGTERYWVPHSYYGLTWVDPTQIIAVLSMGKASLVLHDPNGPDDRDASRWLYGLGADWYPQNNATNIYYGVGTARHKYVRAKYPNFQYHVMHTETWASLSSSYPNVNS